MQEMQFASIPSHSVGLIETFGKVLLTLKKSLVDIKTVPLYLTWIILISIIHTQRLAGMLYWVSRTTCSECDCAAVKI